MRDSSRNTGTACTRHALRLSLIHILAAAIGGAMAVVSSDDPIVQTHGYYLAHEAYERFSIDRNPRYQIVALEGSGEDYY